MVNIVGVTREARTIVIGGNTLKAETLREALSDLPEINVERGLRFSVNNVRNYRKALYMGLKSIKFKLPLIFSMMEEKEYAGLGVIVHTLMRLMDNIGAESMVHECLHMETLLLNDVNHEFESFLEEYVERLTDFMVRLEAAIPALDSLTELVAAEGDAVQKFQYRSRLLEEIYGNRKTV